MIGADLFPSAARLAWEREREAPTTPRRYAITGPSGTRCGIYPGATPADALDAMARDAGDASAAEWSAATGVAVEAMRLAPVPVVGELCLLPGGLLGRVTGLDDVPGYVRVDRYADDGWHAYGVERESRLTTEGVEGHHHYAAASAAAGDAPAPIV